MTVEEYDKAGTLVGMIKACDVLMKEFDDHLNVEFEITAIHNHNSLVDVTLKGSGAQMLYNAINYTRNTLIKELEDI